MEKTTYKLIKGALLKEIKQIMDHKLGNEVVVDGTKYTVFRKALYKTAAKEKGEIVHVKKALFILKLIEPEKKKKAEKPKKPKKAK